MIFPQKKSNFTRFFSRGLYSPPTPHSRDDPQAWINATPDPQKFLYVPGVYKMTKVLEDGRENG